MKILTLIKKYIMNTNQLIFKAFNKNKNKSCCIENEYKPGLKVKKSKYKNELNFTDTFKHIHEQLNKLKK